MSTAAIGTYEFPAADRVENFHGNQLVYLHWIDHLMFCAPTAYPLPPDMPFGALVQEVIPGTYGPHPDFAAIDWSKVEWELDHAPFTPDMAKGLKEQGVGHKSVLCFRTPGLNGYKGTRT